MSGGVCNDNRFSPMLGTSGYPKFFTKHQPSMTELSGTTTSVPVQLAVSVRHLDGRLLAHSRKFPAIDVTLSSRKDDERDNVF
tara:strand:- start:449 stop:697 length:249 start_codon:yes stop_codon:yes gene_type:complete